LPTTTGKESACKIICTGTPEGGGMAGAFIPLSFQKGSNGGDFSSSVEQICGVVKDFCRISPNFTEKFFVQLLPSHSLPQRSLKPFLV